MCKKITEDIYNNEETCIAILGDVSSDRCYTVEDLMIILNISKPTVYKLLRENHFRSIKIGKGYRIPRKGFDDWLDGYQTAPA